MLSGILASMAAILPVKFVQGVYSVLKGSQIRSCMRRSIRDLVEDEITLALLSHKFEMENAEKFNRKNKKRLKEEIRSRLDATLQSLSD